MGVMLSLTIDSVMRLNGFKKGLICNFFIIQNGSSSQNSPQISRNYHPQS